MNGGTFMECMLLDKRTQSLVNDYVPTGEILDELVCFFTIFSDYTRLKMISALAILGNGSVKNAKKLKFVIAPLLRKFENDEILFLTEYVKEGGARISGFFYRSAKREIQL